MITSNPVLILVETITQTRSLWIYDEKRSPQILKRTEEKVTAKDQLANRSTKKKYLLSPTMLLCNPSSHLYTPEENSPTSHRGKKTYQPANGRWTRGKEVKRLLAVP